MAFDFLGTFEKKEFLELEDFAFTQKEYIPDRLKHLRAELKRLRDGLGVVKPLLDKMKKADEDRGGLTWKLWEPKHLKLREGDGEPHVPDPKPPANWSDPHAKYVPIAGFWDGDAAYTMDLVKRWMYGPIELKRERLEWKVKRTYDLIEQVEKEIEELEIADAELSDWIEYIAQMDGRDGRRHHAFVKRDSTYYGMRIELETDGKEPSGLQGHQWPR